MADRAIFNRKYTSFTPAGTQVWLVNGAGVTTTFPTTQTFTAGQNLIQGQVVYVSGTSVFSATAISGVPFARCEAIGITSASAGVSSGVAVILDDVAVLGSANITAESTLIPGEYYYLSKYSGQVTRYSTASGVISASGASQYQALVGIGTALSTTELEVEIDQPVVIYG
jgi:hypothetical protein